MKLLRVIDRVLGLVLRWFCTISFLVLFAVLCGVVFIRFVDVQAFISNAAIVDWCKLSWSDEIIEWLMSALIFAAAASLCRDRDHFRVELISEALAGTRFGSFFQLAIELLAAIFIAMFAFYSLDLTLSAGRTSPILSWPMSWWYAPMPIAGFIMLAYSIRNIFVETRAAVAGFGGHG